MMFANHACCRRIWPRVVRPRARPVASERVRAPISRDRARSCRSSTSRPWSDSVRQSRAAATSSSYEI